MKLGKKLVPIVVALIMYALSIHIGLASLPLPSWQISLPLLFIVVELIAICILARRDTWKPGIFKLLVIQSPLVLLIFYNSFWPFITAGLLLSVVLGLVGLLAIVLHSRNISDRHLIAVIIAVFPVFLRLIGLSHSVLIDMKNEWRFLAEEGQIMGLVTRVLHGQVPYRDFQATRGPFLLYSIGQALDWFGETLLVKRGWQAFLNIAITYCFYYFCRIFFSSILLRWLTFVLLLLTQSVTYRTGFAFFALALFVASLQKQSRLPAVLAGLSVALALLSSIEAGACALVAIASVSVIGFLSQKTERRLYFRCATLAFAGFSLLILPLVVYFALRGELTDTISSMITYPRYAMLGFASSPFPNLIEMIQGDLTNRRYLFPVTAKVFILWYLAPLLYLFTFFLFLRWLSLKAMTLSRIKILLIAIFGWLLFRSVLGRSDLHHLYFAILPVFALSLAFAEYVKSGRKWGDLSRKAIAIVIIACLLPVLFYAQRPTDHVVPFIESVWSNLTAERTIQKRVAVFQIPRLAGIYASPRLVRQIETVFRVVERRRKNGEMIYAFPNCPMYYFIFDSPNPTRYEWSYQAITKEMRKDAVRDLERTKPEFIIFSLDPGQQLDGIPATDAVPEIVQHIRSNYRRWKIIGQNEILVRNNSPLPGVDESIISEEARSEDVEGSRRGEYSSDLD